MELFLGESLGFVECVVLLKRLLAWEGAGSGACLDDTNIQLQLWDRYKQ
jgi:hypothetical protein